MIASASRLIATRVAENARAVALVLHGGASRGEGAPVSPTQLSVLRMVPIAQRLARAGGGRLAVFRLLNSVRGWDGTRTPVDDVRWALAELDRLLPGRPVGLVGHSLGGRAALLAGDQPTVRSVVALAPWVYANDGNVNLSGRSVLIVHGEQDRIASPERSLLVAEGLRQHTDVGYVSVRGGKHAMLRHGALFDRLAAEFTVANLLGDRGGVIVRRVLDGEELIEL